MSDSGYDMSAPSSDSDIDPCAISNSETYFNLRIGSIFIILVTSIIGTLVPIVLRQSKIVPKPVFEFAKFFGSGVSMA